jgi:hypothetical protein
LQQKAKILGWNFSDISFPFGLNFQITINIFSMTNSEQINIFRIKRKNQLIILSSVLSSVFYLTSLCSASAGIGQIGIKSLKRYVNES